MKSAIDDDDDDRSELDPEVLADDLDDEDEDTDDDDYLDDDGDGLAHAIARLEAAAAAAPTIRPDGKFVFTVQGTCRVCGCTDDRACPGGCVWAEPNLCSRCARRG